MAEFHFTGLGTLINVAAIFIGGLIGLNQRGKSFVLADFFVCLWR